MAEKTTTLHTAIERSTRGGYYPMLEVRRGGVIVFAVTHYRRHIHAPAAGAHALELAQQVIQDWKHA